MAERKKMNIPDTAKWVMQRLSNFGFSAHIVGGCVRDHLLGKIPNDFDMTTNATPEEMIAIFSDSRVIETGIKHGTITVIVENQKYEITTYRKDGKYTDNRHPDSVEFTRSLEDDLSRRDFTVNAICYNADGAYTDIFGGMADIDARIIRAVGNPTTRFREDALRILRALRFAATLNFTIEKATRDAIFECFPLLSAISRERIFTEWKKLISAPESYDIIREYKEVFEFIIPELKKIVLPQKEPFVKSPAHIRELGIFAKSIAKSPENLYLSAMTNLTSDNKRKKHGCSVLKALSIPSSTKDEISLLIMKTDRKVVVDVMKLKALLGCADEKMLKLTKELCASQNCYSIAELDVNGKDLLNIGFSGEKIGVTLSRLLELVVLGKVKNKKEILIALARDV